MTLHIGEKIKAVFESREMKLKDFAQDIGVARQNVYRIFEKDSIDTELLKKIAGILEHNFFEAYIDQNLKIQSKEFESILGAKLELQKDNDKVKNELMLANKEIDYLKKIIELMEERTKLLFANK